MPMLLCALAAPLAAEVGPLGPIGLTPVGAQWFENENPRYSSENFGRAFAVGDFDGDGVDDLATGVPGHGQSTPTNCTACGAVVVRYGLAGGGLVGSPAQILEPPPPSPIAPLDHIHFGLALAAGDFDGDGFDDLAVGIPDIVNERGAVQVFYGASTGLGADGFEVLSEESAGEPQHICDGAEFGWALVAGNFDGDGYADLAIGAPQGCDALFVPAVAGGSVFVFHGKADGLLPFYGYRISQYSFGNDPVEADDRFGRSLASLDLDGDGHDDLAIGVPGENGRSGAVQIVMGSPNGLIYAHNAILYPADLGDVAAVSDFLGWALAGGDFDGDGRDDLAIGIPWKDIEAGDSLVADAGSVDILYGAPDPQWFDLSRTEHLSQSIISHDPDQEGAQDHFGSAVAAGNFDGDRRDDLAVGHPQDSWGNPYVGAVTVLMGAVPSIGQSTRFHLISIGRDGVPGDADQELQSAGAALAAGDFDASGRSDLVIGAPEYDGHGAEVVLYSDRTLLCDTFESGTTDRWSAVEPEPP